MKNLVLFITLVFISQVTDAQLPTTSLSEMGIKGHVKTIVELAWHSKTNEDFVDTSVVPAKRVIQFDNEGNETDEVFTFGNKTSAMKYAYNYSKNKIVTLSQFDGNNKLKYKYVFTYVDDKLIELLKYEGSTAEPAYKFIYKYDGLGNRFEESIYGINNVLINKNTLLYNENNQRIQQKASGNIGDKSSAPVWKYTYDKLGNLIKTEILSSKGDFQGKIECGYFNLDKNGNWTLKTENNTNRLVEDVFSKYNLILKRNIF